MPFVQLSYVNSITMGPVLFWNASKYQAVLPARLHVEFKEYIEKMGTFVAIDESNKRINALKIKPNEMTCISIDQKHSKRQNVNELIFDSAYLLYFSCNFSGLLNSHPVEINPYLKIWNAEESYLIGGNSYGAKTPPTSCGAPVIEVKKAA